MPVALIGVAVALVCAFMAGRASVSPRPVVPQVGSAISYIPPCPSIAPGNRAGPCVAKP